MITETLLAVVMAFVKWFVGLVPDFGLDLSGIDMGSTFQQIGSGAAALNGWVPVVTLLGVLVVYLIVQVAMSVWGFILFVYHQFWGSE